MYLLGDNSFAFLPDHTVQMTKDYSEVLKVIPSLWDVGKEGQVVI